MNPECDEILEEIRAYSNSSEEPEKSPAELTATFIKECLENAS